MPDRSRKLHQPGWDENFVLIASDFGVAATSIAIWLRRSAEYFFDRFHFYFRLTPTVNADRTVDILNADRAGLFQGVGLLEFLLQRVFCEDRRNEAEPKAEKISHP